MAHFPSLNCGTLNLLKPNYSSPKACPEAGENRCVMGT